RYPWPGIELEQKQRDLVPLVSENVVAEAKKAHKEKQSKLEAEVKPLEGEIKNAQDDAKKKLEKQLADAKKAVENHNNTPLPFEQAYAVADAPKIEDVTIQIKGDPEKKGPMVPRHFPTVMGGAEVPRDTKSSGRRELADWIVSRENPLAARVMANRIWHYHFGRGLVPTPNDFGKQGKLPTHPELLDYLATRFVDSGWSIKSMHRLIMLARTYQLSSARSDDALARDASNELLTAFPRRRLDAESIRDTMLALAAATDERAAGPHPFPPQTEWKFTQHNPFKATYETRHRSIYLMTQRIQRDPYLAIFDGADPAASTAFRTTSTTPLQALYLLNDKFVHEQARGFAKRLLEITGDEPRITRAYEMAFARPPTPDEVEKSAGFIKAVREKLEAKKSKDTELETWRSFTRALFRLNEFVYID
ncbi:MAG TPA: DUF1553 domain-containing protein, partial [Verrucomicrobiae bacterium]|nr:DUF1553 domain-containing protein [Verrucomicrobiae bacterium]